MKDAYDMKARGSAKDKYIPGLCFWDAAAWAGSPEAKGADHFEICHVTFHIK